MSCQHSLASLKISMLSHESFPLRNLVTRFRVRIAYRVSHGNPFKEEGGRSVRTTNVFSFAFLMCEQPPLGINKATISIMQIMTVL